MADETHPVKPEFDNRHIEKTDLGFPVVRLHDTYSHSFQRPFGHTINKQGGKHNTQRLAMGTQGRPGGVGKMEECLGVNGRPGV